MLAPSSPSSPCMRSEEGGLSIGKGKPIVESSFMKKSWLSITAGADWTVSLPSPSAGKASSSVNKLSRLLFCGRAGFPSSIAAAVAVAAAAANGGGGGGTAVLDTGAGPVAELSSSGFVWYPLFLCFCFV